MKRSLEEESINLLKELIKIPSYSTEENLTADLIESFLKGYGIKTYRKLNNVWVFNQQYDILKPTILLNSHHDTVKPNSGYTRDPFSPDEFEGKLYGLGSNDAGGCLTSLMAVFLSFYEKKELCYNLCFAATAEEENSGANGLELIQSDLGPLDFAIVGEPTLMNLATAERGLMVLNCVCYRTVEYDNPIYAAIDAINWFQKYEFEKVSQTFGRVMMSVTIIATDLENGSVPDKCDFTVDIRVTDSYRNEEILEIIRGHVFCEIIPKSVKLKCSVIEESHPIVQSGLALGKKCYCSPTTSDRAVLTIPSLKIGPGDSARSHMADEFIYVDEIKEGIQLYQKMLAQLLMEPS